MIYRLAARRRRPALLIERRQRWHAHARTTHRGARPRPGLLLVGSLGRDETRPLPLLRALPTPHRRKKAERPPSHEARLERSLASTVAASPAPSHSAGVTPHETVLKAPLWPYGASYETLGTLSAAHRSASRSCLQL